MIPTETNTLRVTHNLHLSPVRRTHNVRTSYSIIGDNDGNVLQI